LSEPLDYSQALETLPTGYARHRVVLDDNNNPIDYIFLTVNAAFEEMTGLKREKILSRKVTEVLPGIEKSEFDWIGIYGQVALGGTKLNFEQFSEPLKRWYNVQAYSDEPGHFTTVINEITSRKNELASMRSLLELSEKLIASDQGVFDYQSAIDSLLSLSGAKFAAINTYEEGRTKTVTRAIAGVSVLIFAASQTLGFEITGRAWDIIPERLRTIEGGKLVRFKNLFETSMGAINETTATMLQELFRIGDIYVLELAYGGRETMGDIIFFMPKKKEIQNREVIELYAGQIGSLLARLKAEEAVSIANKNMTTVLENSLFGVAIIDKKRTIRWVNPVVCKLAGVESSEVLIGSQCGDYLCPAEQHQCPILDKGQKLDNSERTLRRHDGQVIPILKSVTEIMLEGEEVLLETFIDISERKQAEEAKDFQLRFQQIAAETSAAMVGVTGDAELNFEINTTLKRLGELFATDRSYLFQFSDNLELMSNTHEWCAPGVETQMENIQNQATGSLPWWKTQILKKKPLHIPDVTALPPHAAAEKKEFLSQNIRSLVCLPTLGSKGSLTGFIGFDMVKQAYNWPQEQLTMLQLVADTIGGALERRRAIEALHESELKFRSLTDNLPGVAYRCLYDQYWTMKYMSNNINSISGYPSTEFINNSARSYESIIHCQDSSRNTRKIENAINEQNAWDIEYRLIHRDGTVRWVQDKGQAVLNTQGAIDYLDGLILDITDRKQAETMLEESEHRFNLAINGTGAGLWDWDMVNDKVFFSTRWKMMLGYADHEIENAFSGWQNLWHPDDVEKIKKAVQDHLDGKTEKYEIEHRLLHKNGTWRNILTRGDLIKDENGKPVRWVGTNIDLTHIKRMEEELADRLAFEEMIASISSNFLSLRPEQIDEGINYTLKSIGEFFDVDRSYLYRFSEDGDTYSITHQWHREDVESYFEKNQDFPVDLTPWWVGELKSGRNVSVADVSQMANEAALDRADFLSEEIMSIFTLPLTLEGKVFGCFGFDTTKEHRTWTDEQVDLLQVVAELFTGAIARHDADRQIRNLSFHDQLTGLYNRRYFEHELERLNCSREHPIAVISADLDGLKLINDTIGHSEGDRYLQAGAEVLKSALRASDILARVGGDEFALLLPRTDKVAAEMLVNRIRRQLEQYNLKQKSLPLSISLGLAVSESADYPLEEIYRMADNNMYTDKLQQGKKARAEIVSSLLASLFERGNLAEGERDQVQELAIRLGQALKLSEDHLARLALFAQVYDLGKVGLPDSIIHSSMHSNTGELTEAEREALHRHPESGYRIASSSPELADVAELILKHHENYDGSGYPLGLKEDAIPVECRILSIAVAYSAMTNPRPYAKTLSHEEALAELKSCAGGQFDPDVVEIFVEKMA
jgi:diguanylate cyclase (GGDEF)-like protein/PAS domain S-box-containing protein